MQLVLGHLSTLSLHQPGSSSAIIIRVLQQCSSPCILEQAHGRLIYVGDQDLLPGRHLACQIVEPWRAREGFKYTEVRTDADPNRNQIHLPIGAQKRPHLRLKSGPAGTFCETRMSSPGETKMSSPGETPNCFSIVKASPEGADCLTRRAHFGLVFLLPAQRPHMSMYMN